MKLVSESNLSSSDANENQSVQSYHRQTNTHITVMSRRIGSLSLTLIGIGIVLVVNNVEDVTSVTGSAYRRSADHKDHHSMMHNHLSRKVFDRACAASKDTIDEIVACLNNNPIIKNTKKELALSCYKESYGMDFDPKDIAQHKDVICKDREKFEVMTGCVYKKTAESVDQKELDRLTEAMVDVGLCIINALDG